MPEFDHQSADKRRHNRRCFRASSDGEKANGWRALEETSQKSVAVMLEHEKAADGIFEELRRMEQHIVHYTLTKFAVNIHHPPFTDWNRNPASSARRWTTARR